MTAGSRGVMLAAVAGGVLVGGIYSLSPLTVLCLPALAWLTMWAVRDRSPRERQWIVALVAVAVVLRLLAIAGLFLTAGPDQPFANFFGDEEFFKQRSLWRRNMAWGVPISAADAIYLFDEVGWSSYIFVLAFVQALVGAAPYGVHVLNTTLYVASVLLIYRLVRSSFGGVAALTGLAILLYWPSLFAWSISALKEPLYTFVAAVELTAAVALVRARAWRPAAVTLVIVVASIWVLDTLRRGGFVMAVPGVMLGAAGALLVPRPRLALAAAVMTPVVIAGALSVTPVQDRVLSGLRRAVSYHAGHVGSAGIAYQLVEPRYYLNSRLTLEMPPRELAAFVVKATAAYVVEPLPWHAESRLLQAYLPEQMAWLLLVGLAMVGVAVGVRHDAALAGMLAGHAAGVVVVVALTSGNIGTLIRHRGLAMPYLAWLAGIGLCEVVRRAAATTDWRGRSMANDAR